jgi:hypothetical protein
MTVVRYFKRCHEGLAQLEDGNYFICPLNLWLLKPKAFNLNEYHESHRLTKENFDKFWQTDITGKGEGPIR